MSKMSKTKDDTVQKLAELKAKEKELLRQLRPPRHICEDVTSERLAELMEQNNEEMVSCSTDARGACKTLFGKYRSGNAGDEDPYIKGFSGDRLSQDRIGRSGACLINPILTVAWCVQLDHFDNAYANPTLRESGFLARCLPCRLEANSSPPKYENDPAVSEILQRYSETLRALFNEYHLAPGEPRFVKV